MSAISEDQAALRRTWEEHGCVVLEGTVPDDAIDRLLEDLARAAAEGDDRLLARTPEDPDGYVPLRAGAAVEHVADPHAHLAAARDLLLSDALVAWLRLVFDAEPLLFRALAVERGEAQGPHQDSAYVAVSSPQALVSAYVALEDAQEGSGELVYWEGSHRVPEHLFSGRYKHWNPERDGDAEHEAWRRELEEHVAELPRRTFLPRKGDVLVWSADLVHAAAPVTDEGRTRRSLVAHYCPVGVEPAYFGYREDRRTTVAYNGGRYASEHHDLEPEPAPPEEEEETIPTAAEQQAVRAERRQPSGAEPSGQPLRRRSGGLVGRVRGILGDR
ncbi:MAG: phytanoyl-CoA dioxygenase family protein [Solirubrobacterales bacterium]|nr:phytanoyl-CoA dioxygenase family protein [Solirubrobacterales bacterium]